MIPGDPPAVILGGDANAVSAVRTLARAGVRTYALGGTASPVRYSRMLEGYAPLGVGEGSQQRWLGWLLRESLGAVLIPCADDGVELLARNRKLLESAGYVLPEMDDELALVLLDKELTYERARERGLLVPRTAVPGGSVEQLVASIGGLPCALKPRRTRAVMPPGFVGKAFVVRTPEELARTHARLSERGVETIATEIVQGSDRQLVQYWSYVQRDGTFLLELTKHKLRQQPPDFGTGCYQAIAWDEEVAAAGRRFATGMGVVGFSAVEFKRRAGDGALVLIECNYRLIDSNEAGRVAGVDAARVVYHRALGRTLAPAPRPREGVRFWHPVRDLRSAVAHRRRGELTLPRWVRSVLYRQVTPYFSAADPAPSAMVAFHRVLARLPGRHPGRAETGSNA